MVLPILPDESQGWTYVAVHIAPNGGMFELKRIKIVWGSTTFFPSHYSLRVAAHSGSNKMDVIASATTVLTSNSSISAYLGIVRTQQQEFPYNTHVTGYLPICRNEIGDTCSNCTEIIHVPRGWDASYIVLNISRYAGSSSTFGEPGVAYSIAEIEVLAACVSEVCTMIGNSPGFMDGDGRIQTRQGQVKFNKPTSLVLSTDFAFIFLIDHVNRAIRKITVNSLEVTTVAGGQAGHVDGVGTKAKFAQLSHMVMHPDGERLFVTDSANNNIRCIDVYNGNTSTYSGSVQEGYVDGRGQESKWNSPRGIAISTDGRQIFVADCGNNRLRKILLTNLGDVSVTTLAGNGVAGLADGVGTRAEIMAPWGLTISPDGRLLYFSMQGGFRLRYLDLMTSEVKTIAGRSEGSYSGPGMHAQFGHIFMDQAAWSEDGNIMYFTDRGSNLIRYFEVSNEFVGTIAGANPGGKPGSMKNMAGYRDGESSAALFESPFGVALDNTRGLLYASEYDGNRLRTITFRSRTPKFSIPGGQYNLGPGQTAVIVIAWAGDNVGVHFTSDGSEPTLDSPIMIPEIKWDQVCTSCEGAGEQAEEGWIRLSECMKVCSLDRRCTSINHDGSLYVPGLCMLNLIIDPEHWSLNLDVFPAFYANPCSRQKEESKIWCAEGPWIATKPSFRHLNLYKPRLCINTSIGVLELKGGKHVLRAMSKSPGLPPSSKSYMEIRVTEMDVGTFAGHETPGNMDGYGSIARFGRPIGVAINPSGRIFVSDTSFNAVRTIDSVTALSATIGEQVSSTHLPSVLAVSNNGRDLFVVDWAVDAGVGGARIQHLQLTDDSQNLTSFRTLAGSLHGVQGHQDGNGVHTLFHGIQGIALSEQNSALVVYVSCSQTHSIRRVDVTTGQVRTLLGSGDINVFGHADGSGVQALFHHPWSIAISSDGNNLYISEAMSTYIRHVQLSREHLGSIIPLMVNTIQAISEDGPCIHFTLE